MGPVGTSVSAIAMVALVAIGAVLGMFWLVRYLVPVGGRSADGGDEGR